MLSGLYWCALVSHFTRPSTHPHPLEHPSPLLLSRGFTGAASTMGSDLERALMVASEGGKLPIVVDTSPCLSQIKSQVSEPALKFALYEPVEFIRWGGERGGRGQGRCRGRAKEGAGCRSRLSSPRCTSRRRSSRCVCGGGGQGQGKGGGREGLRQLASTEIRFARCKPAV